MRRHRRCQRQIEVAEDFAEEEHRSRVTLQRERVFTAPGQTAARCEFDFEHRRRIGEDAMPERPQRRGQLLRQRRQARAQYLVVVAASGVDRDHGLRRIGEALRLGLAPVRRRATRQVVHSRRDDAQRSRNQLRRPRTPQAVARHVRHAAVAALREPIAQPRLGLAEVDVGNSDLGESERRGPAAQLSQHVFTLQPIVFTASKRHLSILGTRSMVWAIEADCAATARALARHEGVRDAFIELSGPLGAGKTTFVRHLLRALGVTGRVKSPSYAVVEAYELPELRCWHFDFYRFKSPREWEDAGFRDVFATPGLKLAEWPEKAHGVLPTADLRIDLEPLDAGDARQVQLSAFTPRGVELLE